MNPRYGKNFLPIFLSLAVIAFLAQNLSSEFEPGPSPSVSKTPIQSSSPVEESGAPEASETPWTPMKNLRKKYMSKPEPLPPVVIEPSWYWKPNGYVDAGNAPDWFMSGPQLLEGSEGMSLRDIYEHQQNDVAVVFRQNLEHVVPIKPKPGLGWCTTTETFLSLEERAARVLQRNVGNWYRYDLGWVSVQPRRIVMDVTDPNGLRLIVSLSEDHSPEWCRSLLKELESELRFRPDQLNLLLPPKEFPGTKEWMVGRYFKPSPRFHTRV